MIQFSSASTSCCTAQKMTVMNLFFPSTVLDKDVFYFPQLLISKQKIIKSLFGFLPSAAFYVDVVKVFHLIWNVKEVRPTRKTILTTNVLNSYFNS